MRTKTSSDFSCNSIYLLTAATELDKLSHTVFIKIIFNYKPEGSKFETSRFPNCRNDNLRSGFKSTFSNIVSMTLSYFIITLHRCNQ